MIQKLICTHSNMTTWNVFQTGELMYAQSGSTNTSQIPISIWTPYGVVRKAYLNDYIPDNTLFYKVVKMHYKKTL